MNHNFKNYYFYPTVTHSFSLERDFEAVELS